MSQTFENVGFIGLGVMGASACGHLLDAGHRLHVLTRTRIRAAPLLDRGALWGESPFEMAEKCDVVFTMVGTPQEVEDLYFRPDGLMAGLRPSGRLVDLTTSSPVLAERIAREADLRGGGALDAPVSGGDRGAREATLSIMVGGAERDFEHVLPLFQRMGKNVVHQGPAGSGQHCKMCNQMAIAGMMMGVCEAFAYARRSGLNPETVLRSLSTGAAASWTLSNLVPRMLSGDWESGFAIRHFIKDLGIALESAREIGLRTPSTELAWKLYRELAERGTGREATQALFTLYA
jgi:3-hydroxyisobutyrate dehydrogenase